MDEHLRLDARRRGDVVDLLEGQLAGQHHPLEAEVAEGLGPGPVVYRQLRAGVQFQAREVRPGNAEDAEVLQDDGVDAEGVQAGQVLDQLGQFVLADHRVDGDEDAAARRQAVGVGDGLGQLVGGEVLGLGAGGELLEAEVDGVGAEVEGGEGGVRAAGGGQQFDGAVGRGGSR